jgi:hypothetical protein
MNCEANGMEFDGDADDDDVLDGGVKMETCGSYSYPN